MFGTLKKNLDEKIALYFSEIQDVIVFFQKEMLNLSQVRKHHVTNYNFGSK